MKKDTQILHGASDRDLQTGAVCTPIYSASTFHHADIDCPQEFDYSRSGNPTRKALEKVLAVLEGGTHAYAFASGVAAITAALTATLKAGDHVVATRDIYGGTYRILKNYLSRFGISHTFVDTTDPKQVAAAVLPQTKVLFLESPSNPLQRITDFEAMAKIAISHQLISMVDNTFLSPYFFNPLRYGIDISIHSATKFLGGHSDLIAGAAITANPALGKEIYNVQNMTGSMLSPENSWLLMRGIKTLSARMVAQSKSAQEIAEWLSAQSWVKNVYYPGLINHPGHEIISRQASGFGAVVSFEADSLARTKAIMKNVKLWAVAVSLGGVESILSYPAKMSHAAIPKEERLQLGITDELVRLSVGLEDSEDLKADLLRASKA